MISDELDLELELICLKSQTQKMKRKKNVFVIEQMMTTMNFRVGKNMKAKVRRQVASKCTRRHANVVHIYIAWKI